MTATAMTERHLDRAIGPGERAMLARQRQSRRTSIAVVGVAIAAAVLLPFALGLFDGLTGAPKREPEWARAASISLIILTAIVGGWVQWRQHDEVLRRRAINAYAAIGAINLLGFPLIGALAPLGIVIKPDLLWAMAILGGIATYLYQRRGG